MNPSLFMILVLSVNQYACNTPVFPDPDQRRRVDRGQIPAAAVLK
jgi:hypothetical protein